MKLPEEVSKANCFRFCFELQLLQLKLKVWIKSHQHPTYLNVGAGLVYHLTRNRKIEVNSKGIEPRSWDDCPIPYLSPSL